MRVSRAQGYQANVRQLSQLYDKVKRDKATIEADLARRLAQKAR